MVVKVKKAESYKIEFPYTCDPETTIDELLNMMTEKGVKVCVHFISSSF